VLYLTRGLLNVLQQYAWEPTSNARCVVYLHVLDMLSTAAQETYPYHIEKGNRVSYMFVYICINLVHFPRDFNLFSLSRQFCILVVVYVMIL
jgi:hypothetical protein